MQCMMILAFAIYMALLFIIGYVSSLAHQKQGDAFLVGNRSINWWVTALSAHAADMSDWLLMGFPAAIYLYGMYNVWIAITLVLGMFASWHFIAPALRRQTEQYHAYTLISYFEKRCNDRWGMIRIAGTAMIAFFFAIYIGAFIKGVGYLLESSFGIPYHVGAVISVAIVAGYTMIGGYVAVAWVELFQGLFLLAALLITPLFAFLKTGGLDSIIQAAHAKGATLSLIPNARTFIQALLDPVIWGLGYLGMPHILSKFMGAQSADEMHKSKYLGIAWQIIALSSAAFVGFVAMAYFTAQTAPANPEWIFIEMSKQLFPCLLAGFILCAIMAASLSTMDAQVLVLASLVANDIYKNTYNPHATTAQIMKIYRAAIIIISLVGLVIAWNEHSTVFGLVKFAWAGLGASFGPLVVLSLYSRSINAWAGLAGIIVGGSSAILWQLLNWHPFGFTVNSMAPGFLLGMLAIIVTNYFTNNRKSL